MVLAILGPTPETEIKNLKIALSVLLINPKSVCASSRIERCVYKTTFSSEGSAAICI